jgi:hypothetical protein
MDSPTPAHVSPLPSRLPSRLPSPLPSRIPSPRLPFASPLAAPLAQYGSRPPAPSAAPQAKANTHTDVIEKHDTGNVERLVAVYAHHEDCTWGKEERMYKPILVLIGGCTWGEVKVGL